MQTHLKKDASEIPLFIAEIARQIESLGGQTYLVGGCVRDRLLGLEPEDFDIEVYGISGKSLAEVLSGFDEVVYVGKSFAVFKIGSLNFALPQRSSVANSDGLSDQSIPSVSLGEALRRRDLSINSIAQDVLTGELHDPFGGLEDLQLRMLRATDSATFVEDRLRPYRIMQLAGRLGFSVDPATAELCRSLDLTDLPRERVFEEFKKLLMKSPRPSVGLKVAREIGILEYHPELKALVGCLQNFQYHPEGDVWTHTLFALDAAAGFSNRDIVLMLAVLTHDFGKPQTTISIDGQIHSYTHEVMGEALARSFLGRLTNEVDLINEVTRFVRYHLAPYALFRSRHEASEKAVRRLASKVNIDRLVAVARADFLGKGSDQGEFIAGQWLLAKAAELGVKNQKPKPIIMGRDLIKLGLKPGPHFKIILNRAFEAQLDGTFSDIEGGLRFILSDLSMGQKSYCQDAKRKPSTEMGKR